MTVAINGAGSIEGVLPVAFRAHNNGVAQSVAASGAVVVNLSTEAFDHGSYFAANRWTPPAGRAVVLTGVVALDVTGATDVTLYCVILKNGGEVARGSQFFMAADNGGRAVVVSLIDVPNGTDYYELAVTHINNGSINLPTVGASTRTSFAGARL